MNAIAHATSLPLSGPKLDNRRVLAAVIDLVIVGAGGALILAAAGAVGSDAGERGSTLGVVILGWALYYYFACESSGGQTVGKRLLKLRVLRADGGAVGMREVAVRTVLRVVDGLFLYLLGLIVMLATGERRGRLGDLAAGTIVADASSAKAAPEPDVAVAEPATAEPVAPRPTVTLPRPPVPTPVPELRPFEPEPAAEPLVVAEPEPEPVVEAAEPELEPLVVAEPEPVVEAAEPEPVVEVAEPLVPEIASPSLQELARDLAEAAARGASQEPVEDEPADEPAEDEAVVIKPVETVSAIDLVMGGDGEDEDSSPAPDAPQV